MLRRQVLSKSNISNLYQSIIRDSQQRYNDKQKKIIANKIIDGLKMVSSKVDENRVNQSNVNKILNQINSLTLNKIKQEISYNKIKNIPNDSGPQISQISMERDFMANPRSGIRVYDRPQPTASSFKQGMENKTGAFSKGVPPNRDFEVNSQRDSGLLEDRLAQIQAQRENMSNGRVQKELPKALQPISTNKNANSKQSIDNQNSSISNRNTNKYSQDNYHLTNDTGENKLNGMDNRPGSLDDVFKNEFTDIESFQEDTRPLEARLNDLKSMRDIDIPNNGELPPPQETNIANENNNKKKENIQVNKNVTFDEMVEPPSDDEDSIFQHQIKEPTHQITVNRGENIGRFDTFNMKKLDLIEEKLNKLNSFATKLDSQQKFQLIIDSRKIRNKSSNYRYNLSRQVSNVTKIELVNYSIPDNYYNINSHNNEFTYYIKKSSVEKEEKVEEKVEKVEEKVEKVEEKVEEVQFIKKDYKLEHGLYTIDQILEQLNSNTELIFSMGFNQKIKISYDDDFKLHPTNLIRDNLGFMVDENNIISQLEARNIWDLRQPSYFLLYVDNIDTENPLAILNIKGSSFGKIEFESPIPLDYLQIKIEDENGKLVNFQGRYHNLTFVLTTFNNY